MNFDDRPFEGVQRIENRYRRMRKCSRIDHDATCGFPCLVNPVDDLVFTVRLMKAKLKSKLSSDPAAIGLDIGKSFLTVDMGLTFAEQIQVGTVQYVGDAVHVGLRDQACLMWAAAETKLSISEATELRGSIAARTQTIYPFSSPNSWSTAEASLTAWLAAGTPQ